MPETTPASTTKSPEKSPEKSTGSEVAAAAPADAGPLTTDHGKTTIADVVVTKIAGIATREVNGVYDVGGTTARTVGALRERIPGSNTNLGQGVRVEVGERQAAVDLDIVAEYGVALTDLADGVRQHVIDAIERMTGLEVTEVNLTIHDVHVDGDEAASPTESRVQ